MFRPANPVIVLFSQILEHCSRLSFSLPIKRVYRVYLLLPLNCFSCPSSELCCWEY